MSRLPAILLHVCCAPCAAHPVRALAQRGNVTFFFSNSNIHPLEEYRKREGEVRRLADIEAVPTIEDEYDHQAWLRETGTWRDEPEGGRRCDACFRYSLGRAAQVCKERGFDAFTTTLTVSPHKDSARILAIGRELGPFLEIDFKKRDGFRKSVALSREHELYRQRYCGCEFSLGRNAQ